MLSSIYVRLDLLLKEVTRDVNYLSITLNAVLTQVYGDIMILDIVRPFFLWFEVE